jgi:hypothetical protein
MPQSETDSLQTVVDRKGFAGLGQEVPRLISPNQSHKFIQQVSEICLLNNPGSLEHFLAWEFSIFIFSMSNKKKVGSTESYSENAKTI